MSKSYSKNETISKIHANFAKLEEIYTVECCNWKGKTSDTKENYSKIIAGELLNKLEDLSKISVIPRSQSYFIENHFPITLTGTNRIEENFAYRLCGLTLEDLGYVMDYQVPIKGVATDKAGKIDLISYNKESLTLYLIELKTFNNQNDSLLKSVLEIYTYYRQIDKSKIKNDYFSLSSKYPNKNELSVFNINDIKVKPIVLLTSGCKAYSELENIEEIEFKKLKTLILALDVELFTIDFNIYKYL